VVLTAPVRLLSLSRYTEEGAGLTPAHLHLRFLSIFRNAFLYLAIRRSTFAFASIACSSSILTALSPVCVDPTRPTYLSTFSLLPFDLSYRQM